MITYTFKLIKYHHDFPKDWKVMVDNVVEIQLPISEYDSFKKEYNGYLERYLGDVPGFKFDSTKRPDGRFMERLSNIQQNYPGAKDMFKDAKWQPKREW